MRICAAVMASDVAAAAVVLFSSVPIAIAAIMVTVVPLVWVAAVVPLKPRVTVRFKPAIAVTCMSSVPTWMMTPAARFWPLATETAVAVVDVMAAVRVVEPVELTTCMTGLLRSNSSKGRWPGRDRWSP